MRSLYEIIHIWTAVVDDSEEWSSQLIFQFKQLERRSLKKNQGFNGIRTRDLRDTGAMLYQLSSEATHWERGQLIEFISSREEWNDVKFIWNNSYMNCGCRWQLRMIIAVNFPIRIPLKPWFFSGFILNFFQASFLIFFRLLLSNCLNWKINCDDHSSLSLLLILAVSDVGVGLLVQPVCTSLLIKSLHENNPGCNTYKAFYFIAHLFSSASFLGVVAV